MRIAFLLSSLKYGGAERVVLNLAKVLREMGFEVDILLMSREGEFLAEAAGICEVVDLDCDRTWKLPGRLRGYLENRGADVLISSFWKLNLCASLAALRFPSLRLLLWEHSLPSRSKNSPNHLYAISASLFYRRAKKVICVSNAVKNDVSKLTIGLRKKTLVIHNPIPGPGGARKRASRPDTRPRIAWVGRLAEPKNPGLMLQGFSFLTAKIDAELVYVGDGPLREDLQRSCNALGLADRVRFEGFVRDPYDILETVDLLALTSRHEGFGNVLIEALHCGLPVVSTDCSDAIYEILLDSDFGSIVPNGDAKALAEAIIYELGNPRDPEHQIQGAARFDPRAIAFQFLKAAGVEQMSGQAPIAN